MRKKDYSRVLDIDAEVQPSGVYVFDDNGNKIPLEVYNSQQRQQQNKEKGE